MSQEYPTTDNHDLNTPTRGARDWNRPLNENFEVLDELLAGVTEDAVYADYVFLRRRDDEPDDDEYDDDEVALYVDDDGDLYTRRYDEDEERVAGDGGDGKGVDLAADGDVVASGVRRIEVGRGLRVEEDGDSARIEADFDMGTL
ncbi:hypothetical protein [Halobacterium litoreum]|uniref:Halobacterial output domain-containing protein n=1 Tax=Halobacterium litoreum TaxID=2039234 RepID=A0ABD5NGU0_9EURY|nr:hypothetical protein [Halobacterium litoreum]UHH12948.1 hypothetical protein LT972_12380 [Halobacterium litoreum]